MTKPIYSYDNNDIDWWNLSQNSAAIRFLEENLDKVYWASLSLNPAAIHLLEKYPERILTRYWKSVGRLSKI